MLGSGVSPCDYPDFSDGLMLVVHTFRTSVGDIDVPEVGDQWHQVEGPGGASPLWQRVAILSTWGVWLINLVITLIILLNFLIAEVGQTYERVRGSGK